MAYSADKPDPRTHVKSFLRGDEVDQQIKRLLSPSAFLEISIGFKSVFFYKYSLQGELNEPISKILKERRKISDFYLLTRNFLWWSVLVLFLYSHKEFFSNIQTYRQLIETFSGTKLSAEQLISLNTIIDPYELTAIQLIESTKISLQDLSRGDLCLKCCRNQACKERMERGGGACMAECLKTRI